MNHFWPPQAARAAAACDPHCARPSATEPSYLPMTATTAPPRVRAHAPPTLPAGRLDHYFTLCFGQSLPSVALGLRVVALTKAQPAVPRLVWHPLQPHAARVCCARLTAVA